MATVSYLVIIGDLKFTEQVYKGLKEKYDSTIGSSEKEQNSMQEYILFHGYQYQYIRIYDEKVNGAFKEDFKD
ncbi:hypothetical protein OCU04_008877 [Sclerotinia nivalis]|uniref:Uncharacterized protein n=1 Tax=Sclerotinia nivalis TaxID=352851 RepID=A0A9X0DGS0_9HELO|nr:hypothetical protein OCU04_008877 [Sclerotinia nivalis]